MDPNYPFGHGLSYSDFNYSELDVKMSKSEKSLINVSFLLTNNSQFYGEDIVQLYFRDSYSSVTRPVKELLKYKRVGLKAKESKRIKEYTLEDQELQEENIEFDSKQ